MYNIYNTHEIFQIKFENPNGNGYSCGFTFANDGPGVLVVVVF